MHFFRRAASLGILSCILSISALRAAEPAVQGSVIVRHAPSVEGRIEGPVQILTGETFSISGNAVLTGDLFLPGTPGVVVTGAAQYAGTIQGTGNHLPDNYVLTLSGNASLQHVATRTDPVELASVEAPQQPAGTRDVVLSQAGDSAGDFATLRNLTLNANVGVVSVPPGTYGQFIAHSQSSFRLGVAGATQPTVYNLQQLTLDSQSSIELDGPVVLLLAQGVDVTAHSRIGIQAQPHWMLLRLAAEGVSVRGHGEFFGHIRAPSGLVTIEGRGLVRGSVYCDQLVVQGRGKIESIPPLTGNQPPVAHAGPDQTVSPNNPATLTGSATDDGLPNPPAIVTYAWSKFSGPGNATFANPSAAATTVTFSADGVYILRLSVSDSEFASHDDIQITVAGGNQAPVVNAGADQMILAGTPATLQGAASDDGSPNPPATLTTMWTKVSGPGTVTFADAAALATTATFSASGVYVLRLSASDSDLAATDDLTVVVNAAPVVNAGPDMSVQLPGAVNLAGSATDDGLPIPPGALTISWSKVSGPGIVNFVDASVAATSATFSSPGVYVLRLTAGDGHTSSSDDVQVTATPANQAPTVNAGANQIVDLPAAATLNGSATDDGLPNPPGALTYSWMKVSGPGTASFANGASAATTVSFSASGVYMLRLTVSDSQLSAFADTVVTANQRPAVNAGVDQIVTLPVTSAALNGSATDDGLPSPPGATTVAWSKVNGPGTVTFANAALAATTADFSQPGTYTLRLSANDSRGDVSDDVVVVVNQAPVVAAGAGQTIRLPQVATLAGTASDDGLPNPPAALSFIWSKVSGPGTVTFSNGNALNTTATFSQDGTYVLRLSASDSVATTFSDVTITVLPANTPPAVSAGLDQTVLYPQAALLNGTATDDGVSNALTIVWTKVSGPGTVTFADAAAASTTATFGQSGVYTLRLSANDGEFSVSDDVVVLSNQAPTVSAGNNQTIRLPETAVLSGLASDDGFPNPPGALALSWSKVSGPGTVTFSAPNALNSIAVFDQAGTYVLRLTASDSINDASSDVNIIVLPPPTVSIEAADPIASEEGANTGLFSVRTNVAPTVPITVNYTIDGTASNGADYTLIASSVVIEAGNTSATILISPLDDSTGEPDETVILTLANGFGYTVDAPTSASITIEDNDPPVVMVSASDALAAELGTDTGTFTVSRLGSKAAAITVNFTITGTATSGSDFTAIPTTVTIPSGVSSVSVTVFPINDTAVEPDETILLTLAAGTGYTVGPPDSASVFIADDEPPVVSISTTHATVLEGGAATAAFSFTRLGSKAAELNVNFALSGTAALGADYTASSSSSVAIPAGSGSALVTVTPVSNTTAGGDKTVLATLTAGTGYSISGAPTATIILEDDDLLVISATHIAIPEGESASLTAVLAAAPLSDVAVTIVKIGGDPGITILTDTHTFRSGNWNTPRNIVVQAANDNDAVDNTATLTITARGKTIAVSATACDTDRPVNLSSLVRATAFDAALFSTDTQYRDKYLATVEPARAWALADAGQNIPVLKANGSRRISAAKGQLCTLSVTGAPNAPVTFTSLGMDVFDDNKKTSVTKLTDQAGLATVIMYAGAAGKNSILVGSPLSSGQVRFVVQVQP